MRGWNENRGAGVAIAALVACLVVPAAAPAAIDTVRSETTKVVRASAGEAVVAKKKKKKKKVQRPIVTTASSPVTFGSGTIPIGTATCPANTHSTGGGFTVAPAFSVSTGGLRTLPVSLTPSGVTGWSSSSAAYTIPAASGTLATHARCEGTSLGTIVDQITGSTALPSGGLLNLNFICSPGSHVVGGGFTASGPTNLAQTTSFTAIVIQSRRTNLSTWTVSAINPNTTTAGTLGGYAICEQDRKGTTITEALTQSAIGNQVRTASDASCSAGTHSVSGGFNVTLPTSDIPFVGVDENAPVGEQGWHAALYEFGPNTPVAGTALQTQVLCKPDVVAKKKKKKKKKKK